MTFVTILRLPLADLLTFLTILRLPLADLLTFVTTLRLPLADPLTFVISSGPSDFCDDPSFSPSASF